MGSLLVHALTKYSGNYHANIFLLCISFLISGDGTAYLNNTSVNPTFLLTKGACQQTTSQHAVVILFKQTLMNVQIWNYQASRYEFNSQKFRMYNHINAICCPDFTAVMTIRLRN